MNKQISYRLRGKQKVVLGLAMHFVLTIKQYSVLTIAMMGKWGSYPYVGGWKEKESQLIIFHSGNSTDNAENGKFKEHELQVINDKELQAIVSGKREM